MNRRTDILNAAYEVLKTRQAEPQFLCTAIVQIAKPFDGLEIRRAAPLVTEFLKHDDFLVRYQAIWFLGCWGKLPECLDNLIDAAKHDAELDNRAFAARCAGSVLQKHKNIATIASLLEMTKDQAEEEEVRLAAYSALLRTWSKAEAKDFEPTGGETHKAMDPKWLDEVTKWIANQDQSTRSQAPSLNS